MRISCWIIVFILMVPIILCLGPHGPFVIPIPDEFYYPTQYFECTIEEEGASLKITQTITIYCSEGCVEKIDIIIPYGEKEIIPTENGTLEDSVRIENPAISELVPGSILQNQSHNQNPGEYYYL